MKKLFILILMMLCLVTGCGKYNEKDVVKEFEKKISNAYKLNGDLTVSNGDEIYNYQVEVSYKKHIIIKCR